MEYRVLGRTGLRVSAIGFGSGNIGGLMVRGDPAEQRRVLARAIEEGITYFDTAPIYGNGKSEETLGPLLRELRADVVVGTKVLLSPDEAERAPTAVRSSLEGSLRRLGREQVDLFQLHNRVGAAPVGTQNPLPVEVILGPVAEGLAAVREAGLTRFIGLTGLGDTDALKQVVSSGTFDTVQCYLNAVNPSAGWPMEHTPQQNFRGLISDAASAGLGVIAIRVLAAGALAAAPDRHPVAGDPGAPLVSDATYERDLQHARALAELAAELDMESPAELSLRLVLILGGVSTALVGFSEMSHLESALRWSARGPLEQDVIDRILALAQG